MEAFAKRIRDRLKNLANSDAVAKLMEDDP
jgi:hypothetical protein